MIKFGGIVTVRTRFYLSKSGYLVKRWTGYMTNKMVQNTERSLRCTPKIQRNETIVYVSGTVVVVVVTG